MGGKTKRRRKLKRAASLRRSIGKLKERARSEWCEVRQSEIHGSGVYAAKRIPEGERIIEYVGERISKAEGERRGVAQMEHAGATGGAAVYIFTLSEKYDLDGSMEWNTARLLNHSCEPNGEPVVEDGRIQIYALREIEAGEELTFDYGFDLECWEEHPCRCGAQSCVGHIVSREQWDELRARKAEREGEEVRASA